MKIKIRDKSRKSQQEILGFALIVMIVVIVAVIFLGISLRKGKTAVISVKDAEIANFLSASMRYTTNCILKEPFYAELKEVFGGCSNGAACSDSITACDVLNKTYSEMLAVLWPAGADRPVKYTRMRFYYKASAVSSDEDKGEEESALAENEFLTIESGDSSACSSKRAGRYMQSQYQGNIIAEFERCE